MEIAVTSNHLMVEAQVRQRVDHYLAEALGTAYTSSTATARSRRWSFLIAYQDVALLQPCIVGNVYAQQQDIGLNNDVASIIPLTAEQIREIRETAAWEVARRHGELARTEDGYISRHQARRLARRWLDQHLSMKFSATGGQRLPSKPPVWQFLIEFNLQDVRLEQLGVIDVNAQTGAVTPLPDEQLDHLREQVRATIQLCPSTAAI
ncbi:MAG: hypothetical protein R3C14_35330 [Caldilineaceae bacterium]